MVKKAKRKDTINIRIFLNLFFMVFLPGFFSCKFSKNTINGYYYKYPSKENSAYVVNIKDSSFLFSDNLVNGSGSYFYTKKADTLFLRTLKIDSVFWKKFHPVKYVLINRGYIYMNLNFQDTLLGVRYNLDNPIFLQKRNMLAYFRMTILYRNSFNRFLEIKNKESSMKCKKIDKVFKQDCNIHIYHQASARELGLNCNLDSIK